MTAQELADQLFELKRQMQAEIATEKEKRQRAAALAEEMVGLGYDFRVMVGSSYDDLGKALNEKRDAWWTSGIRNNFEKKVRKMVGEYFGFEDWKER